MAWARGSLLFLILLKIDPLKENCAKFGNYYEKFCFCSGVVYIRVRGLYTLLPFDIMH